MKRFLKTVLVSKEEFRSWFITKNNSELFIDQRAQRYVTTSASYLQNEFKNAFLFKSISLKKAWTIIKSFDNIQNKKNVRRRVLQSGMKYQNDKESFLNVVFDNNWWQWSSLCRISIIMSDQNETKRGNQKDKIRNHWPAKWYTLMIDRKSWISKKISKIVRIRQKLFCYDVIKYIPIYLKFRHEWSATAIKWKS